MRNSEHLSLIGVLVLVLAVRLGFLALFHHQVFSGPSTQFEQAFVAMNLADGKGIKIFRDFPPILEASDPTRIIDPERYEVRSPELQPYIREVPGYAFFLAGVWKIFGSKLWIYAQITQIIFEVLAAWGLYTLAKKFFGHRAGLLTVLVFAFTLYEARVSIIPYKDIFLLYLMLRHHPVGEPDLFGGRLATVMVQPGLHWHRHRLLLHADHRLVPDLSDPDALAPEAHQVLHGRDVSVDRLHDRWSHGLATSKLRSCPSERSAEYAACVLVQFMAWQSGQQVLFDRGRAIPGVFPRQDAGNR